MCKGAKNTQWRKDRLFNKCCRENWISKCQKMGFPGGSDGEEFAMQETWISSLGQEDPLEKRMATHFSILA